MSTHQPTPSPSTRQHVGLHLPALVGRAVLVALVSTCLWNIPARAQTAPGSAAIVASFEGRQVREVVLRRLDDAGLPIAGDEGLITGDAEGLARNTIRTSVGSAFSTAVANKDISLLARLGQFENPRVQVSQLPDTTVRVTYLMRLQPVIRDVQVVGNRAVSDESIRDIVKDLVGTSQSMDNIKSYADQVERMYKDKGYYAARVTFDRPALNSQGVLIYRVREGRQTNIADVRFEGNLTFTPRELSRGLKATAVTIFEPNRVNDDDLTADISTILSFYRDRGYYAARVDKSLNVSPEGDEAIVTFVIDEGPVYTLRHVTTVRREGDQVVLSNEQILGLLAIKPGDVYGNRAIDQSVQKVQDAYWTMGFADAEVYAREQRDPDSPQIDLVLHIAEGPFYRTGEVIISGNDITRQKVIRREVTLQPGRPLDRTQERETLRRIRNTGLFAPQETRVTIQPASDEDPEFRDVLVEIHETNTGNFAAGGTVSSDGGLGARVSLTERNFDVTNPPHSIDELFSGGFRGGGQTFNIEASPGDRVQRFAVSLGEPSLFDSNYSGTAAVNFNQREYRQYDETRYGASLTAGRRFGSRWIGRIPVRVQWSELSDIDADAPVDYYNVADLSVLTSVGVSLERRTLDNNARPTKGSVTEFSIEQAGALGGDYEFTNFRAEHKVFIPILEDVRGRRTVLQIAGRTSYIPQDMDDVPLFERSFLGGQNFRGFALRGIGPRGIRNDTGTIGDDPIGGTFSLFLGAEVQQPIYEDIFALAFFVDSGTLNTGFSLDNYRVSVGAGLRVIVPGLSPVPLAFDFGVPVLKEDFDEERLFTFSIDVPF